MPVHLLCLLKSGAIGVTIAGTAVTSRAAPTSRVSSTSSPARTAAACPTTLSATATTTAGMSLTSWSTCATHRHPPAPPESSGVTTDTVSPWARCATGATTALTTAMRRDAVSVRRSIYNIYNNILLPFQFLQCFSGWCMLPLGEMSKKCLRLCGERQINTTTTCHQPNYRTVLLPAILIIIGKYKCCSEIMYNKWCKGDSVLSVYSIITT